jgi:hypothetical protein
LIPVWVLREEKATGIAVEIAKSAILTHLAFGLVPPPSGSSLSRAAWGIWRQHHLIFREGLALDQEPRGLLVALGGLDLMHCLRDRIEDRVKACADLNGERQLYATGLELRAVAEREFLGRRQRVHPLQAQCSVGSFGLMCGSGSR